MALPSASKHDKLSSVEKSFGPGKVIPAARTVEFLETVVRSGDRILHEGDNQKQGDFLAEQLSRMTPEKVHDLEHCASCLGLPEHLDLFDNGLASRVNFAYAGPQGSRLAKMVFDGKVKIGAISRVTKMPLEKLQDLARTVSVFAPGCDSFFKMGGVYEVWSDRFSEQLGKILSSDVSRDLRANLGRERGGRACAQDVIDDVVRA